MELGLKVTNTQDAHAAIKLLQEYIASREPAAPLVDLDQEIPDTLALSIRVGNLLRLGRIYSLRDLVKQTESSLLAMEGFGTKSLLEVKSVLQNKNLSLST